MTPRPRSGPHRPRSGPRRAGADTVAPTEPHASPTTAPVGKLGRYEIHSTLGAGGMGEVLGGRDAHLGREVALKVIKGAASAEARAKFLREARVTGQLEHPAIVPVHELGQTSDGQLYFAMKRIAGHDLDRLLKRKPPPPLAELAAIFVRVCQAVGFAHAHGVIHRDLKPANIMVGDHGEVYVVDWGLAKRQDDDEAESADVRNSPILAASPSPEATSDGSILGTPAYMPPEQAEGKISRLDAKSDVYSLGAILYHMLAGTPPYSGATVWAILDQVLSGPPAPPSQRARRGAPIPWELEAIAMKAMATDPRARYPSAAALVADVEAFLAGRLVSAARYNPWTAVRKWVARHKAIAAGIGSALLALGAWSGQQAYARRVAIATAREAVRPLDVPGLVAAASEVILADDPVARILPPAGEMSELGRKIDALQEARERIARWRALDPDDPRARAGQFAVLMALGRLAEARHDDALARLAYRDAGALGVDDKAALDRAQRASEAHAHRLDAQARRIARELDRARSGALAHEDAYLAAVAELASYRDRQTVDLLLPAIDEATVALCAAVRATFTALAQPDAAERALGGQPLEGMDDIALACTTGRPPELSADQRDRLKIALERIVLRDARLRRLSGTTETWDHLLGIEQGAALAAGGRDRARALRLACDVLGLLGDAKGVLDPLTRYLWTELDQPRAIAAGLALARLARHTPEAAARLLGVVGIDDVRSEHARIHFMIDGPFWQRVEPELAGATGSSTATRPTAPRPGAEPEGAGGWNRHAMALEAQGQPAAAIEAYGRALALDPRYTIALVNRGLAYMHQGNPTAATADFDRAIELDPACYEAHYNRANLLARAGKEDDALAGYSRAIEVGATPFLALAGRAQILLARGTLDDAARDVTRAVDLAPRNADVALVRARLLAAQGPPAAAIEAAGQVLALDERNTGALKLRGQVLMDEGDPNAALADLTRAVELDGTDAQALDLRGQLKGQLGDFAGGIADLTRALELDPSSAVLHCNRGIVRMVAGELEGAARDLDRSIELDDRQAPTFLNRGKVRHLSGNLAGAIADYDQALSLDPRLAEAWLNRGAARHRERDFPRALADFSRAVELAPTMAAAWFNRGIARRDSDDLAGAEADFGKSLELDPTQLQGWVKRAEVRGRLGHLDLALADYDRAIALAPRDADLLCDRGVVHNRRDDPTRALADFAKALELEPRYWIAFACTGDTYRRIGKVPEAIRAYERAAELAPAGPKAQLQAILAELRR